MTGFSTSSHVPVTCHSPGPGALNLFSFHDLSYHSASLGHLGPTVLHLDPILGHLGPSVSHLGSILGHLGPSVSHLGSILAHLGPSASHLGAILGHLELCDAMAHTCLSSFDIFPEESDITIVSQEVT